MKTGIPEVAILGGGIAGLTAAYLLKQQGITCRLFEQNGWVGGKIRTEVSNGYLVEHGPNSLQSTTPLLNQLIEELGLSDERLFASQLAKKRFVIRRGQPVALPMSPPALISSGYFSLRTKLRLLREPVIGVNNDSPDESIAHFVERRLGREILDYAVDPFVTGIFAGNPETLSVRHAFPMLFDLEQQHGSLLRGLINERKQKKADVPLPKRRIFSFQGGMQTLIYALARALSSEITLGAKITSIQPNGDTWNLQVETESGRTTQSFRTVLSTIPLPALQHVSLGVKPELSKLWGVNYPPISVLALGFRRDEVDHPLDGFGMLTPGQESSTRILGTIFSSTVFPGRAPDGHVLLTSLIGGARRAEMGLFPLEMLQEFVLDDLHNLLGVHGEPTFVRHITWDKAIPQYDLGYGEIKQLLDLLEHDYPGLYFAGNYRAGISVGDAMRSGENAARKLVQSLSM